VHTSYGFGSHISPPDTDRVITDIGFELITKFFISNKLLKF
jgi:hypothetical protein